MPPPLSWPLLRQPSLRRASLWLAGVALLVGSVLLLLPRSPQGPGTLGLTREEEQWLRERKGTLVVAPTPDYPPVEFLDTQGRPAGFAGDYMRLLEEKLHITFQVRRLPTWTDVVRQGQTREIDLTLCCQRTVDREAFWDFTAPFLQIPTVMVLHRSRQGEPRMEQLGGLRLGAVETFASYQFFKRRYPNLDIRPVSSDLEGLQRVNRGELDVFFSERPIALHLIQKHDLDNLRVGPEAGFTYEFSSASRNDQPILNRILQKAQNAVTDEEWHALSRRWFTSVNELHVLDWRRFGGLMALAGGGIVLILAWNLLLRRQVRQRTRALEAELHERRVAERALAHHEAHLRITLDALGEGVVAVDAQGHVTRMNPAAEALTGMSAWEALGRPLGDVCPWALSPEETSAPDAIRRPVASELVARVVSARDGREIILAHSRAPLRDATGQTFGLVLVFREITTIIRLEEQLRHAQKMDAIGQLAGGVAHDFNNALVGILAGCDVLERQLPPGSAQRRNVSLIRTGSLQATSLIKRLLAFARKTPLVSVPVDMHDIISKTAELLCASLGRSITLECHLEAATPWVRGDPGLFQSALLNLGINARDAMPGGGTLAFRTFQTRLDASQLAGFPEAPGPGDYLAIAISDTGEGIPATRMPRIFEPFFTTKAEGKGTGLGLSAVYSTVREHHGALRVESEVGVGTTFTLYLPPVEAPEGAGSQPPTPSRKPGRVLVVDDEPIMRDMAREVLEASGFEVLLAPDGEAGWHLFLQEHPNLDAVLLDMVMPGLTGGTLCRRIHAHAPGMRVVLTSGFDRTGSIEELLREDAWAFLQKPFKASDLISVISQAART